MLQALLKLAREEQRLMAPGANLIPNGVGVLLQPPPLHEIGGLEGIKQLGQDPVAGDGLLKAFMFLGSFCQKARLTQPRRTMITAHPFDRTFDEVA